MYCQKCVDPVGEVKSGDWVWTQIAKRLGIAEQYNPRMAHVPDDQGDAQVEELHREAYEKWAVQENITSLNLNPPAWKEFQRKPVFRWAIRTRIIHVKKTLTKARILSGKPHPDR